MVHWLAIRLEIRDKSEDISGKPTEGSITALPAIKGLFDNKL